MVGLFLGRQASPKMLNGRILPIHLSRLFWALGRETAHNNSNLGPEVGLSNLFL